MYLHSVFILLFHIIQPESICGKNIKETDY